MAYITINGYQLPPCKRGVEIITSTTVDSGRNANAQVVAQRVGRDQYKINNIVFPWLSAEAWQKILSILNNFFVTVSFQDPVDGSTKTLKMYVGDRSGQVYYVDKNGKPLYYRDCKFNLIDTGE
jgi:hypothetical protein